MLKIYMTPALQVNEAQAQSMMAFSLEDENADPDKEVLAKEIEAWEYWDEEGE